MRKMLATIMLLPLALLPCRAQTNVIYGYMADLQMTPTAGTAVTMSLISPNPKLVNGIWVSPQPVTTYTDANGFYSFKNVSWGEYEWDIAGQALVGYVGINTTGSNNVITLTTNTYAFVVNGNAYSVAAGTGVIILTNGSTLTISSSTNYDAAGAAATAQTNAQNFAVNYVAAWAPTGTVANATLAQSAVTATTAASATTAAKATSSPAGYALDTLVSNLTLTLSGGLTGVVTRAGAVLTANLGNTNASSSSGGVTTNDVTVKILGGNSVSINGVITNFASSTTAGIQESWNQWLATSITNFGPTANGIKFQLPDYYTYFSTPIFMSNNYPFAVTFAGCDALGSKLVFTGTNTGISTIKIVGGTNSTTVASGTYNFPAHVFFQDIGFSATNNTTNTLVEVDNYAWLQGIGTVLFEGWDVMYQQPNGVEMSMTHSPTNPPGLIGLKLRVTGDHLTSFNQIHVADLACGVDARCDHLQIGVLKCSMLGLYQPPGSSAKLGTLWPLGSEFAVGTALIRRSGIDTQIGYFNPYTATIAIQNLGGSKTSIGQYERDESKFDFVGSTWASMPVIKDLFCLTTDWPKFYLVNVSSGYAPTTTLGSTNSVSVVAYGKVVFSSNLDGTKFYAGTDAGGISIDTNGLSSGNGGGFTNLSVPYLTFSNALTGKFFVQFQSTNIVTITTNYSYNSVTVTNGGTAAVNGTYGIQYFSLLDTRNYGIGFSGDQNLPLPYGTWTNSNGNGVQLIFNDTNIVTVLDPMIFDFVQSGNILYDNDPAAGGNYLTVLNNISSGWEVNTGAASAPTVAWTTITYTTNYVNRVYPVATQPIGATFGNVDIPTNALGTHGYSGAFTNGLFYNTGTY